MVQVLALLDVVDLNSFFEDEVDLGALELLGGFGASVWSFRGVPDAFGMT